MSEIFEFPTQHRELARAEQLAHAIAYPVRRDELPAYVEAADGLLDVEVFDGEDEDSLRRGIAKMNLAAGTGRYEHFTPADFLVIPGNEEKGIVAFTATPEQRKQFTLRLAPLVEIVRKERAEREKT